MIQEFDISITAVGEDKYLVRTEQVAPGVPLAQEQVQWPIEDWLKQTQTLMHDPLLGLLKGQSPQRWPDRTGRRSDPATDIPSEVLPSEAVPSLVNLGQDLYNKLFCGLLRDSWLTAQGVAQNRRQVLRLRLGLKDPRLQQLPWEVLHAGDRPLATGTDVTFSRYHADIRQGRDGKAIVTMESPQPLRILMVIASPEDQERLELKREVHHLRAELHPLRSGGRSGPGGVAEAASSMDVQLTILEQPGRTELTQALEQGNYQVLHYAGHSNLGNAGGDLYLVSRQTGLTERLSGEDLAGLLVNNGVKLAVFNSCRGAYTTSEEPETGWQEQNLAQALVNRGVPGILAMAERIPDDVAITFTRLLYRNLKQGHPIDLSLNRTRQGLISAYGSHQFYWALPILYMQPSFNGYLVNGEGPTGRLAAMLMPAGSLPESPWPGESETKDYLSEPVDSIDLPETPAQTSALHQESTVSLSDSDLDDLVETLEYEDLLRYNDDAGVMAELIEQLSQPPSGTAASALLPELLETPGLSWEAADQSAAEVKDAAAEAPQSPATASPVAAAPLGAGWPLLRDDRARRWWRRHGRQATLIGLTGAVLATAVGVGIADPFNWFSSAPPRMPPRIDTPNRLDQLSPEAQGELALAQNDLEGVTQMAAVLISQNNQQQALTLLTAVPPEQQLDPVLSFLMGRAQWQLFKQGNRDYTSADAIRSWERALEVEPNWVDAHIALGFAEYRQQNWAAASDHWRQAIRLAGSSFKASEPTASVAGDFPMILNAYAGLAMVNYKLAQQEVEPAQKEQFMRQAAGYQLKVLFDNAVAFQPQNLGNNWLWLESAIADWREARARLADYLAAQPTPAE